MDCVCRFCCFVYESKKSRAEIKGYCSASCQHSMAKDLGFKKGGLKSEHAVLKQAKEIGNIKASSTEKR